MDLKKKSTNKNIEIDEHFHDMVDRFKKLKQQTMVIKELPYEFNELTMKLEKNCKIIWSIQKKVVSLQSQMKQEV